MKNGVTDRDAPYLTPCMIGLKPNGRRRSRGLAAGCSAFQERILSLLGEAEALPLVARRIMQRHKSLHSGEPGENPGLPCCQMATHLGLLRIGVQECRLDEEDIGAFGELNDLFLIS